MIFSSKGLLGINARNLLYIKPYNKREAINLADSKLKTKHYLSARGIPVPKLYSVIKDHDELNSFDFGSLPGNVVLKPNRGLGGEGIIAFKEREGNTFLTVGGNEIDTEELKNHIIDILDGRFSINNTTDTAFFEQRIVTPEVLTKYTYKGLPDIRIIVYNLTPVMAMLRLPTKESDGRANLAQGAVGVGIDLSTGKPTHIAKKNKIVSEIPGIGKFDSDFKIPHFDEMLLIASKCQLITNLGYLACDIALDESGPILLEINARAGLKVQIANKAPLRKRLEQIEDINVSTPEKGVRVAKDVFGLKDKKVTTKTGEKIKTIGLEEVGELILPNKKIVLKIKIEPDKEESIINKDLKEMVEPIKEDSARIKLNIGGQRVQTIVKLGDTPENYGLVLGKRDLKNFLIDVNKKIEKKEAPKLPKEKEKSKKYNFYYIPQIDFGQVDHQIYEVAKSIKLIKRLTPTNLKEEIAKFTEDTSYNPQFSYESNFELVIDLLKKIENIKTDESNLGIIFEEKRQELLNTVRLIEHIGTDGYKDLSTILYDTPTKEEVTFAMESRKNQPRYETKEEKKLNAKKAAKIFQETLKKYELKDWKVDIKNNMVADCSVNKSNTIFVKSSARFSQQRIKKLIAHEIETHILTAENGKKQPYRIFQNGTTNYLETQEGLAIYNQELALNIYPHSYFAAFNLLASHFANQGSFAETYKKLRDLDVGGKRARSLTLKVKRGLGDTSKPGCTSKEAIYLRGARKISEFVENGNKLERLYIGKISVDDIDKLEKIQSLNPPVYLPDWY